MISFFDATETRPLVFVLAVFSKSTFAADKVPVSFVLALLASTLVRSSCKANSWTESSCGGLQEFSLLSVTMSGASEVSASAPSACEILKFDSLAGSSVFDASAHGTVLEIWLLDPLFVWIEAVSTNVGEEPGPVDWVRTVSSTDSQILEAKR